MRRNELTALIIVAGALSVLLVAGWRIFWFLCDDAFISFRYVSNSILGHGYVWNPPPFEAVEGYTNFLWIVLLDLVWRVTGVSPPRASNVLSLFFSAVALVFAGLMIWRIDWTEQLRKYRVAWLGLGLLGLLTNRTFLAWTSSGLETAMFVAFILLWLLCALRLQSTGREATAALMSLAAALTALTRPDGLLFCLATVLVWLFVVRTRGWSGVRKLLLPLAPLALVVVHLLWRKSFYGEWLPNTYYAKLSGIWPESGVRYAGSFILEYAIWFWLCVLLWVVVRRGDALSGSRLTCGVRALAVGAFVLHAGYYVIVVGGDHFEYRIFSHLVVLIWVSTLWALNYLRLGPRAAIGMLVAFLALSLPLPWTHWAISRGLEARAETYKMRVAVAPRWPEPLRWYARGFDRMQSWLIGHMVGSRHQEHKIAYTWWAGTQLPTREEGKKLPADGYPVMIVDGGIGTLGWVLPQINLIDLHGLNDYVIARGPSRPRELRMMAHDRLPPEQYVAAFRPNVRLEQPRRIVVRAREKPLSAEEIVAIEKEWRERVRHSRP